VWGVTGASFILGLPLLNGVTAFSATTSIACAGLALTYSLPIVLRIVFRASYLETGPFTLGRCAPKESKCPLQHLLGSHICSGCLALRQTCMWFSIELMCYAKQLQYCLLVTGSLSKHHICCKLWTSIQFWCRSADIGFQPT